MNFKRQLLQGNNYLFIFIVPLIILVIWLFSQGSHTASEEKYPIIKDLEAHYASQAADTTSSSQAVLNSPEHIHEVKEGETLYRIAQKYNTTARDLQLTNNLADNELEPDQKLKVKVEALHTVKSGETMYAISRRIQH